MKLKIIKQTVNFKASPREIYEILMDSKKHSALTGSTAKISRKIGGKFSVYDGALYGKNIELLPDKKIVQEWRNDEWTDKNQFSILTIKLIKAKNGTKLEMTHKNIPDYDYQGVKEGWNEYYWNPLKEMIKKIN
jgi:activator of HSP90 ATPase